MECKKQQNSAGCNCTYPCDKKGMCCECISYHRAREELPACYFDGKQEKTYDRSIRYFIQTRNQ